MNPKDHDRLYVRADTQTDLSGTFVADPDSAYDDDVLFVRAEKIAELLHLPIDYPSSGKERERVCRWRRIESDDGEFWGHRVGCLSPYVTNKKPSYYCPYCGGKIEVVKE